MYVFFYELLQRKEIIMDKPIYQQSPETLLEKLNSSKKGLTSSEAKSRYEKWGPNEIHQEKKKSTLKMFFETFKDPMVIVLLIVAIIQILLGEVIESIVILGVVLLSSVITVVQEKKAESSLQSLKSLSAPSAQVVRDHQILEIDSRDIVVGDIVLLDVGDYIPADGRLLAAESLQVEEGALTGESIPANKELTTFDEEVPLGDQKNMVFSSTLVTNGRGEFVVTATANDTEMGKVAALIQSAGEQVTPLQRKLGQFSTKLGWGILGLSVFIFALHTLRIYINGSSNVTADLISAFMFAVAVAVAAIPEALQSIVTIVLSSGTNKMAKRHAIIRKLPAVETLGSTSVICTDKTGTLTQNKMTVVDTYLASKGTEGFNQKEAGWSSDEHRLLQIAALANDSSINEEGKEVGDPTEVALTYFTKVNGFSSDHLRQKYPRQAELPFDSTRKLMSTLHYIEGENLMLTKGGPDIVFNRSSKALVDGEIVELTDELLSEFQQQNETFAKDAKRVLALAYKPLANTQLNLKDENDLVLVGLTAMIDPPREEVAASIEEAKNAGIRTIMITGDHKTTAHAIAKDLGIFGEADEAVSGKELDAMSDKELDQRLEHISVYARVTPENKIRIVKAWQNKGRVTSMTGDGVNDAPALKRADIGVAMGSGTDVAKDASAMILTDDNFVSIISAIEVGRNVFNNIKKSIGYLFSGNLGAVTAIVVALLINWPSPFTALQLLFINLVNDSLPAIALGMEPGEEHVMDEKPRDPNEGIFAGGMLNSVVFRGLTIAIAVVISQLIGLRYFGPEISVAMAFTTLILSRTLQVFSSRSKHQTIFELGLFTNKYVVLAFLVCIGLYILTVLPGVRLIFDIPNHFGLTHWLIASGLALATTIVMELKKLIFNSKKTSN